MMIHITEHDIKLSREMENWMYMGEDGKPHLREDAPIEIKKHYKKIKKVYSLFED